MDTTLFCDLDASSVPCLAERMPLALTPLLGSTVLEQALVGIASAGFKTIELCTSKDAARIRPVVGCGQAWGVTIHFREGGQPAEITSSHRVITLDRLPQFPDRPLWESYRGWHTSLLSLLPSIAPQRVGTKEIAPGVFAGLRSKIHPLARLEGPCWIGAGAFVGQDAHIGPGSLIEDGVFVDRACEIVDSFVGPRTYVGAFTELRHSLAWGQSLVHLDTGSVARVVDQFLLNEISAPASWAGIWRRIVDRSQARLKGRVPAGSADRISGPNFSAESGWNINPVMKENLY